MIVAPQPGKQAQLLACPADEILYGGARGGGKSHGALLDWVAHAERYGEDAKGIAFRRSIPELEDFMLKAVAILRPLGWSWGASRRVWTSAKGATLKMRHLDRDEDADSYQGHEYTWIAFEEAGNWPSPAPLDKLRACLRSAKAVRKRMILTCNPGGPGHNWIKARFVDPAPPMTLFPDPDNRTWRRCFIPARLEDNRKLCEADPNYRMQIAAAAGNEQLRRAWLEGDWNIVAGGMFDDVWNASRQVFPAFPIPENWRVGMAHDWGSAKPSATLWVAEANGEEVTAPDGRILRFPRGSKIVIQELYTCTGKPNEGTRWTAQQIGEEITKINAAASKDKRWRVNDDNVADSAIFTVDDGRSIADSFSRAGIHWKPANKGPGSRSNGWQIMRQLLQASATGDKEKPGLFFFEHCRNTLRTLPTAVRDKRNPDDIDTESEDHALDALRYSILRQRSTLTVREY